MPLDSDALDALTEQMLELGGAPASVTVDGQTVTEPKPTELIALDKHLTAKAAMTDAAGRRRNGWAMVARTRFQPPGGV